jgi:protocatechuate 3,4-dioxygenase beta subunit
MVSSARQAITIIFVVIGITVGIQAQTTTPKAANGSVSGKVTIKGKPAAGLTVVAKDATDNNTLPLLRYRAKTDQTGSYRITNLPAGTYIIFVSSPVLVPASQSSSIVIAEGEQIDDANISLVPGGVITGKVTDSEGEPLIEQQVRIRPAGDQGFNRTLMTRFYSTNNSTDDRGIYRLFGLPPGKYTISAGESAFGSKDSREFYKETFYPSVTDAAKATIIEVTEGSEKNNVDIVMGRPVETFRVTGRVVDGETGKPLPNIAYGAGQTIDSNSGYSSVSGAVTNANGEFRLENLTPGTYTVYTVVRDGNDVPAGSITFEVVDRDLTDLLLKTTKSSSLSGVVVLDGNDRTPTMLSHLRIYATVETKEPIYGNSPSSMIGPDGTFNLNGVRSGLARLGVSSSDDKRWQFEIVRVERNGIPQPDTINVTEGERVVGIRVLVKLVKRTGAIRGQLKVENGELPPVSQLWLSLWPLDENLEPKRTSSVPSPELDARGRFFVEGVPAGTYRLTVSVFASPRTTVGRIRVAEEKTQQVTVTDDTVTEVTLTIKPLPAPKSN